MRVTHGSGPGGGATLGSVVPRGRVAGLQRKLLKEVEAEVMRAAHDAQL